MGPLFLVLYERGFNPAMLMSPDRWAAGNATQGGLPPSAAKAAEEAAANTPPLTNVIRKKCERTGIDPATVLKCASDLAQKLPAPQAREILLAI